MLFKILFTDCASDNTSLAYVYSQSLAKPGRTGPILALMPGRAGPNLAVLMLSPVTILTVMPALWHCLMAAGTSSLTGSYNDK